MLGNVGNTIHEESVGMGKDLIVGFLGWGRCMKIFEKARVKTVFDAHKLHIGDEVIVANTMYDLRKNVSMGKPKKLRFADEQGFRINGWSDLFQYAYLVRGVEE